LRGETEQGVNKPMTLTKPVPPWLSMSNFKAKELSAEEQVLKLMKQSEFKARELDWGILEGKYTLQVSYLKHY